MELAVRTGIPPATWAEEGERVIVTALDVLKAHGGDGTPAGDGRQMSG